MKIYITTDTHLGHDRMIELCNRPQGFEDLILQGLTTIPSDALLIHLGDVCIGNDAKWHDDIINSTEEVYRRILVRGNHDHKSDSWYLSHGWDFVCEEFVARYFQKNILFSHRPQADREYIDYNIHGHLHNTGHHEGGGKNCRLLALEHTNYKPVNLEKFLYEKNNLR